MGGTALFVGIYFTDDEVGDNCLHQAQGANYQGYYRGERDDTELRETSVYCLKRGKVIKRIPQKGEHPCWPLAAWFTPCFL